MGHPLYTVVLALLAAFLAASPAQADPPQKLWVPGFHDAEDPDDGLTPDQLTEKIRSERKDAAEWERRIALAEPCRQGNAPACAGLFDCTSGGCEKGYTKENIELQKESLEKQLKRIHDFIEKAETAMRSAGLPMDSAGAPRPDPAGSRDETSGTTAKTKEPSGSDSKDKTPANASNPSDPSGDLSLGGVGPGLSGKEPPGSPGGMPPQDEAQKAAAQQKMNAVGKRAEQMAAGLKSGPSPESLPDQAGRKGSPSQQAAGRLSAGLAGAGLPNAGSPSAGINLTNPQTIQDFQLASFPYKDAFDRAELGIGRGPDGQMALLRRGGGKASENDVMNLRRLIALEPTALLRNPNYLNPAAGGIGRDDFNDLKQSFRDFPDLRKTDFKDIDLKDEKDFQYDKKCDRASGQCNQHAEKSYQEGEDVPPKSLASISAAIKDYLSAAKKERGLKNQASKSGKVSLFSRLKSLLSGGQPSFSDGGSDGDGEFSQGESGESGSLQAVSAGRRVAPGGSKGLRINKVPIPSDETAPGFFISWIFLILGAAGATLVLKGLWLVFVKRREPFIRKVPGARDE